MRGLLAPFVLRRLKSQVLNQLMPKTNHVVSLQVLQIEPVFSTFSKYKIFIWNFIKMLYFQLYPQKQGQNVSLTFWMCCFTIVLNQVRITPTVVQTDIYNSILERHVKRQRQRAEGSSNDMKLAGSDKEAQVN